MSLRPTDGVTLNGADVVLVSENSWATFRDTSLGTGAAPLPTVPSFDCII